MWKGFVCTSTVTMNVISFFLTIQWVNLMLNTQLFLAVLSIELNPCSVLYLKFYIYVMLKLFISLGLINNFFFFWGGGLDRARYTELLGLELSWLKLDDENVRYLSVLPCILFQIAFNYNLSFVYIYITIFFTSL